MRAGFPAATTPAGRSSRTTLPAPTTVSSPMVTPGPMTTPAAIQTFAPMAMGRAYSTPRLRSPGSTGWLAAQIWTPGPIRVSGPIETGAQSRMTQFALM